MPTKVLLVAPPDGSAPGYPSAAELGAEASIAAETAATVPEAVERLSAAGYDAVICWAERQDQLAALVRLQKARPGTPVLLVTPPSDPVFQELARQLGARAVVPAAREGHQTAELLRTVLASGTLAAQRLPPVGDPHALAREIRALDGRAPIGRARGNAARLARLSFIPLVVERDADSAAVMGQALRRADVLTPHPVLCGRDEAMTFIATLTLPESQGRIVMPTAVLANAALPEDGAVDLVKVIRARPSLARLPVILLEPRENPARAARAYPSGVNSVVERPDDPDLLAARLAELKTYWGGLNRGLYPF